MDLNAIDMNTILCDVSAFHADPSHLISDFLGMPVSALSFGVVGVHHQAKYIGEYSNDFDVERLVESIYRQAGVCNVRFGPSHIAPRFYGVPGYWVNLTFQERQIELFTCRATPSWMAKTWDERELLMSHVGLLVRDPEIVEPLLRFLAALGDDVRVLHYEPSDSIQHTYGHVQRLDTGAVLELVYET